MNDTDTESVISRVSSSSSRPKKYLCNHDGCNKAYSRPSLLEQHKRTHTNERPFPCIHQGCNKSFMRKSHLDVHLISHSSAKPFHCSVCGKGVNTPQHLKRHEVTHTKSFKCQYEDCSEAFYKHQSLRHHILSVHEKTLTCSQCNKTFNRPYKLAQHKLRHHGDAPAYHCDHPGCFSNFKTWSALQFHAKQAHPKLKCKVCGKGCVGIKGLRSHMISHDEDKMIKLWQCTYCDMGKFSKKSELIDHYNNFHDGNIPESLLKPTEVERLEEILQNGSNVTSLNDIQNYQVISSDDEEEDENQFADTRSDTARSQRSLNLMENVLGNGKSIINLISSSIAKKIPCPKQNCNRTFTRDYDLRRHLKWHEENLNKIEQFLTDLERTENGTNGIEKQQNGVTLVEVTLDE
ncbi:PZF1 [[Candida] subhashii]|uniref:Transcription factor IIIA n=1 Tax=[Candida] subhashii TaxID=561895 RepID=A0A8J5ULN5_9ASCO|nr:PZF1 [[Candida] subhashii]KAG7665898.1 PZF1 [[Candida] subhashii]